VASNGLIEKVRTNTIPYSQAFDNAAWIKDRNGTGVMPVVTANNATAPDGTLTADTIVFNAGAGTTTGDSSVVYQTITPTGLCTASFYARVTSGTGQLVFRSVGGSTYATANLTTAWQRFSAAENGSSGFFEIGIRRGLSNEPINASVTVQMWGAQLETGDIATDYIPTTTAAVSVGPVSNVPRLDYLGSTCPRLLLEPQRQNELQFSEQANNAYWTLFGATISANTTATLDPAGYYGADKLQEDTSTGGHTYGVSISGGSTTKTLSVFAKAAERNWAALRLYNGTSSFFAYFNLSTGALGSVTAGATSAITSYGNGWYRCSITLALGAGSCEPNIFATTGDGTTSYQGVTGSGIYVWGAQLEAGAYATSYIPSLNSATTRVADAASKTGISSLIGQTEGTIFFEGTVDGLNSSVNRRIFSISDGTTSNAINIQTPTANAKIEFEVTTGGATQALISAANNSLVYGQKFKAAFAYKANDFVAYINGVQIGTDTSGTVPACSKVSFDRGNATSAFEGTTSQAALFPTRLTNAQLSELTTL
jgi:hypothetical protein